MDLKPQPKEYGHKYDPASKLDMLAIELERKLSQSIYDRGTIDIRMVEDLRNYHGLYDDSTVQLLKEAKRAHPFIKLTRAKTNAAESQLVDLLFPNDDKNWGIKPTPVPELADRVGDDTPAMIDGQQYQDDEGHVITESDLAERELQLIKERCENMELEIEDQLVETSYNSKARQAIHDACVLGTGVVKGPVVLGKLDKAFTEIDGQWTMVLKESFQPGVEVVRPWDFFPDMSASSISEAEFAFERRYMSKQQILQLPQRKGFKPELVQRVLAMTGQQTQHTSAYMDDVRRLAGLSDTLNDTRFETWEYHGPVSYDCLIELGAIDLPEDDEEKQVFMQEHQHQEAIATVFYCGGVVLGARLHLMPYENTLPYRVFNWEPDDSCIFGYGVPRMMRDEQAIINSTWRMILDNASITAGPQLGINRKYVKPIDGDWTMTPFKQWEVMGNVDDIRRVFTSIEFNSHLNELQGVYGMARVLIDEVSGVPMLQQGEQGQATETLGGMSILMNAANTVRRRQVKAWDDNVTSPMITDFYHWNMEFSDKADIKGDYQVDARGTGALLVKETQAQAINNFLQVVGSNPVFQPVLQLKSAQILRQWAKTQQLPRDMLPTDEELAAYEQAMQEQSEGQPQDPQILVEQMRLQQMQQKQEFDQMMAQQKMEADMQQAQMTAHIKSQEMAIQMEVAASRERIETMKLAQNDKMNTEKLLADLKKKQLELEQKRQAFLAEIRMKEIFGKRGNYGLEA